MDSTVIGEDMEMQVVVVTHNVLPIRSLQPSREEEESQPTPPFLHVKGSLKGGLCERWEEFN